MRAWIPMVVLCLLCGCGGNPPPPPAEAGPPQTSAAPQLPEGESHRVAIIIAHRNFQDREFSVTKRVFELAGVGVVVASSSPEPATGMFGATVKPDLLLGDLDAADYDAIVFIGGSGAAEYWHDPTAHALAKAGVEQGKVVAAICLAPVTLANAGLLDGKKATVWKTESGRLRAQGADYTGAEVEVDGLLITGNGPVATPDFAAAVAAAVVE